jgi:hypothetical protein
MASSRQERRRQEKKKMKSKPAIFEKKNDIKICDPINCIENCPIKEFEQEDCQRDYTEYVKKYSLIHHVEKGKPDEDGSYIVEAFSKVICPPDRMYELENDVVKQFDQFFEEIGIIADEYSFGDGFFVSSAFVFPEDDTEV